MKIKTPEKRKEILYTRTQMEVMGESGLVELAKHGTTYERMHAKGILDDRRAGQISTHGRAVVPGSLAVSKIKTHGNIHSAKYTTEQRAEKHAYSTSGLSDPSLRKRNQQS